MNTYINKSRILSAFLSITAGVAVGMISFASTDVGAGAAEGAGADIAVFGDGTLEGWQNKVFKGETRYTVMKDDGMEDGGSFVVQAISQGTASGLVYEKTIDLSETPCLNWSWKVDAALAGLDETIKTGDDFSARVYVIVSGGFFFWNTRALNYVWSGNHPVGEAWPNPYTDRSTMIAAQSGQSGAGQWVMESRHVANDFKRFAGVDIEKVDAVAIMTDTDDSGLSATAYYRDIRFSAMCDL